MMIIINNYGDISLMTQMQLWLTWSIFTFQT